MVVSDSYPTRLRSATPNGDMPNARSPTARRCEGFSTGHRSALRGHRRPTGAAGFLLGRPLGATRAGTAAWGRSRRLRCQNIPIRRSRVGPPRPSPAHRGSETRACSNGGGHGGVEAESETPVSEYPHSAQRSGVEWGRRAHPPPIAGRGPACVHPTGADGGVGRSRRLRCQHIPIRRSGAESPRPSTLLAGRRPARVPTAAGTAAWRRSRRLRCQLIPIRRSRVGSPRPSPAPRGSETRVCPSGGGHGGVEAESETPVSAYPHSAQRSGVEWGRRAPPPLAAGRRPACVPAAAGRKTHWILH